MTSGAGRGPLVCLGDLVEDVVVWPSGPTVIGSDNPAEITRTRGGSAANVAAMAASIGPARFVGRVGDDATGRRLAEELRGTGVDVRVQHAGRTGTIVVLVDADGERTMFPDRGASAELADAPPAWVDGAAGLHVSSYALARAASRAAVLQLARRAADDGAYLSLDTASVHLLTEIGVEVYVDLVATLAADVLIANAQEAALLAPFGTRLATTYVVKDGPRPVRITLRDGTCFAVDVPEVPDVKDTTGAGDAFAAGFLQAVLSGAPVGDAVVAGNALAARTLGAAGATLT